MQLVSAAISTVANLFLLAVLPFLVYLAYQKWRHKRTFAEIAGRAGLQVGQPRYLFYSFAFAAISVAALVTWPPPLAPFLRQGSPQQPFRGLGLDGLSITLALLYGVVKTAFPEELLFRGLIAGSLFRRLPMVWADISQAAIFLIPHLLILRFMPEMWTMLPVIFVGALAVGWIRAKSGSILGPWLIHATLNVTICLSVAVRSAH
jgi:membrane protease YdiL (CAAX protease family)